MICFFLLSNDMKVRPEQIVMTERTAKYHIIGVLLVWGRVQKVKCQGGTDGSVYICVHLFFVLKYQNENQKCFRFFIFDFTKTKMEKERFFFRFWFFKKPLWISRVFVLCIWYFITKHEWTHIHGPFIPTFLIYFYDI